MDDRFLFFRNRCLRASVLLQSESLSTSSYRDVRSPTYQTERGALRDIEEELEIRRECDSLSALSGCTELKLLNFKQLGD